MSGIIEDSHFNSPVIGIDPITKGKFIIEWAYMIWDYEEDDDDGMPKIAKAAKARGSFEILNIEDNPLYKIATESSLRLQGLVGSVTFGAEKKFIRFRNITHYEKPREGKVLLTVIFDILDNLEYLENVQTYRDNNLL